MSRGPVVAGRERPAIAVRPRVAAAWLVLAAAFAAAARADVGSATGASVPVQPQSVKTAKFEAFVRQVGLDMSSVPAELRSEWSKAPRVGIDDCISGSHAGHGHGPDGAERAVGQAGAVEARSDR